MTHPAKHVFRKFNSSEMIGAQSSEQSAGGTKLGLRDSGPNYIIRRCLTHYFNLPISVPLLYFDLAVAILYSSVIKLSLAIL